MGKKRLSRTERTTSRPYLLTKVASNFDILFRALSFLKVDKIRVTIISVKHYFSGKKILASFSCGVKRPQQFCYKFH